MKLDDLYYYTIRYSWDRHAAFSCLLFCTVSGLTVWMIGLLVTEIVGFSKELIDNGFSRKSWTDLDTIGDLVSNQIGIGYGFVLLWLFGVL